MKRILALMSFVAILVPAMASAQVVVVQAGVEPPPPVIVQAQIQPPPPVIVQAQIQPPPPVIVQAQVEPPPPVIVAPEQVYGPTRPTHQISLGVGVPICAFAAVEGFAGSGCVSDEFLWVNIPAVYRYRLNDYLAVGGGLMLNVFAISEIAAVGAELVGSFRAYAIPDWLYFDVNVLLGFPFFAALMPSVGVAVPLGPVSIFLENQVALMYVGGFYGFWQPVLGIEIMI